MTPKLAELIKDVEERLDGNYNVEKWAVLCLFKIVKIQSEALEQIDGFRYSYVVTVQDIAKSALTRCEELI